MAKTPPRQQPTNEVLRNTRAKARGRAINEIASKDSTRATRQRERVLHHNADKAVKRQKTGKKVFASAVARKKKKTKATSKSKRYANQK